MTIPQDKDWDRFWGRKESRRFSEISWSKRRVMALLTRYLRPGQGALDAGCGSGFFSAFFCDQDMRVASLDFSPEALAVAERSTGGRSQLIQADLLNDDLRQRRLGPFHLIFSDGLLEHFPADQQDRILSNVRGVLAPDGILITVVPNRWSPWELIRPLYMPGIEETPFVLGRLKELHLRNGYTIVESGGLNVLPWRVSPEFLGPVFGMLLYVAARPNTHLAAV